MDTIAYHQKLAVLAHDRGDYLSAAQHYQDAANCYPSPEEGKYCQKLAEQELAHKERSVMSSYMPGSLKA